MMEFVSWDDDIPNIWKQQKCSKPLTNQNIEQRTQLSVIIQFLLKGSTMRRIVCVDHRKRRVVWESGIIIIDDSYKYKYIINYPQGRFIVTVTSPVMVGERDGKHGIGQTPQ